MPRFKPLIKQFSYRDQTGQSLETHTEHWRGFTWEAGPVVVTHEGGPWGKVQIWAASRLEGERVIRHAAEVAGVDVDAPGCEWWVQIVQNPRYGKGGTMAPKQLGGGLISVSTRQGPNGGPQYALPS